MASERFELNKTDVIRWIRNVGLFALPLVILFLNEIQQGKSLEEALPLLYAAAIQAVIDLCRKFLAGAN